MDDLNAAFVVNGLIRAVRRGWFVNTVGRAVPIKQVAGGRVASVLGADVARRFLRFVLEGDPRGFKSWACLIEREVYDSFSGSEDWGAWVSYVKRYSSVFSFSTDDVGEVVVQCRNQAVARVGLGIVWECYSQGLIVDVTGL